MPSTPGEVVGGSLLLVVLLLPTGLALLKALELLLRRSFELNVPERLLVGFYSTGALLFVIASVSLGHYGVPLLGTVLGVGTAAYAALAVRERGSGLRAAASFARSIEGLALAAGSVGLLLFEVLPVWNHPFPNAWDGSVTALWTNLILREGALPLTLQPFASAPVIYPLATSVWMTVPVLLLGWSTVQTPVLLPPLFLSLTVPAAYCWGSRWCTGFSVSSRSVGLLFAAFFGLVATWPRFYTGGSYDFAFSLPLFLVAVGVVPTLVRARPFRWANLVAFGLLSGVLTSLSLASGEALLALLLVYSLLSNRASLRQVSSSIAGVLIVAAFDVVFSLRSLVVWLVNSRPSYSPASGYGGLNPRLVAGELDPFVPWKAKMSPLPGLSLELQILLAGGLAIMVWLVARSSGPIRGAGLRRFGADLLTGTVTIFAMTALLLLSALPGPGAAALRGFTNLEESSTLLFIFFGTGCILPLLVSLDFLASSTTRLQPDPTERPSRGLPHDSLRRPRRLSRSARPGLVMVAVLVLAIPLASGAGLTLADGIQSIQQNVEKTSSVTAADVSAMEWMGSHLSACSAVLVAPGSAGQFLPEFAQVRLVFPMNPVPENESYATAVANLTSGVYGSNTRTALLALQVTEVFVTGQTSVTFPAFVPSAFVDSSDFVELTGSADALVFGFVPGESTFGCAG